MSDQPQDGLINKKPKQDIGSLADLLDMAVYDDADIEACVQWWDDNASDGWQGALEE